MGTFKAVEKWAALVLALVLAWSLWILYNHQDLFGLPFAPLDINGVISRLTPLLVTAAFIERGVEVILTPWRAKEADRLSLLVDQAAPGVKAVAEQQLQDYKSTSQRLAFKLAFGLGVLVSLAGIRGLEAFLPLDYWKNLLGQPNPPNPFQHQLFTIVDVLITAAVVGGGADGVHKLVSLITDFLAKTRDNVNAGGAPAAGAVPPAAAAGPPALPVHLADPGA